MKRTERSALFVGCLLAMLQTPITAQDVDYLPVEVGNRWVYEVLGENVSSIGDTRRDTIAFEIEEESFRTIEGVTYFDFPLLAPFALGSFRKDEHGNLWIHLEESNPWGGPAPEVEIEEAWRHLAELQSERLEERNELLLYDFATDVGSSDPDYLYWRDQLLGGRLGFSVGQTDCELYEVCDAITRFDPTAERAIFGAGGVVEESGRIAFEAGIGVTFQSREGIISPYKLTTRLLAARVGGRKLGDYPTLVTGSTWAAIKSRHAEAARPLTRYD